MSLAARLSKFGFQLRDVSLNGKADQPRIVWELC